MIGDKISMWSHGDYITDERGRAYFQTYYDDCTVVCDECKKSNDLVYRTIKGQTVCEDCVEIYPEE